MPGQVLKLTAATDEWLEGFFGQIRLDCTAGAVDLRRLTAAQLRLLIDHDIERPIGHVVALTATGKAVVGRAELVETDATRGPIQDVNAGLKAGLSFGFIILATRLVKEGEPGYLKDVMRLVVSRWQPYELSCTAAPRGVRSKITGGLTGAPEREAASVSASVDTRTAARPKTKTTTRPRRSLDAGLEREASPAPPRTPRRAVSQTAYVDTANPRKAKRYDKRFGRHHEGRACGPPSRRNRRTARADSLDAASPLAQLHHAGRSSQSRRPLSPSQADGDTFELVR